jgi:DNA-binding protein YbaB
MMDDLDGAERWIDNWESSIQDRAAKAKSFAERGQGLTATATDKDRVVEVTVDSSGGVTALNLSERIRKMAAHEVSDLILSVMRAAQSKLTHEMARVAGETMGEDSDMTRTIVASYEQRFPTTPPEEEDSYAR